MKLDHAAILAGGFGKRLGEITKKTPKPLIKINKLEFIKYLIFDLIKNNFKKIIILTHYKDKQFKRILKNFKLKNIEIICLKESNPLGTGGAVAQLKKYKKNFLIMNGDSYCKLDYKKFLLMKKNSLGKILLIKNENYKSNKKLNNLNINSKSQIYFSKKNKLMNAGIYILRNELIKKISTQKISLENNIFPDFITKGLIEGYVSKGNFIDIGLKKNLKKASSILKKNFNLKAVLFDRDGTLNKNYGYVYKFEKFNWLKGVLDTIKLLNFFNIKILIITNQSGIGRGYYTMNDFFILNKNINNNLKKYNSKINKFYCSPYFKFSQITKYRKNINDRKPNNGLIEKAKKDFKLSNSNCFMVGDKNTDYLAAKKSKIIFFKKSKISLLEQIIKILKYF